jgi:hypothetical protein
MEVQQRIGEQIKAMYKEIRLGTLTLMIMI